jgi:carbon monoxide dehydrogenase subunit G
MAAWYRHTWILMEFNDSFEIEDIEIDDVWAALSDPVTVRNSLPGCRCLVEVADGEEVDFDGLLEASTDSTEPDSYDAEDRESRQFVEGSTYAAVVTVSIGPVDPRFDTLVTIDEREFPSMRASGEGSTGDSSFEMDSYMTLEETETGVSVDWQASVDIMGRLAQMGQRMLTPAANRVVKKFFTDIEAELAESTAAAEAAANADESEDGDTAADASDGSGTRSGDAAADGGSSDADLQRGDGGLLARLKRFLGLGKNT